MKNLFLVTAILAFISFVFADTQNQTVTPLECDTAADNTLTVYGTAQKWETSDDKVFYLAPGLSKCNVNYTDQSNVVCVSPQYFANDSLKNCNEWVQVFNPDTGIVSYGRILDECGAVPNSTFGCNDIYLSKKMFTELAGKQSSEALDSGHLTSVQWRKVVPPCWSLWAGLPGKYPNATQDDGFGYDSNGFLRCGKRHGQDRVVGADVAKVCNQNIKTCKQARQIASTLPKYHGGSCDHQQKAVAYSLTAQLLT